MKRRLTCSVKYFCLGAFLIFLGSVLLCGFGLTIVLPHEATRHWPEVTCQVINSSYSSRICSCEYQAREISDPRQCLDSYNCLHVTVMYRIHESMSSTWLPMMNITSHAGVNRSRDIKFKQSADEEFSSVYPGINNVIIGRLYRSWEDEFFKTVSAKKNRS